MIILEFQEYLNKLEKTVDFSLPQADDTHINCTIGGKIKRSLPCLGKTVTTNETKNYASQSNFSTIYFIMSFETCKNIKSQIFTWFVQCLEENEATPTNDATNKEAEKEFDDTNKINNKKYCTWRTFHIQLQQKLLNLWSTLFLQFLKQRNWNWVPQI